MRRLQTDKVLERCSVATKGSAPLFERKGEFSISPYQQVKQLLQSENRQERKLGNLLRIIAGGFEHKRAIRLWTEGLDRAVNSGELRGVRLYQLAIQVVESWGAVQLGSHERGKATLWGRPARLTRSQCARIRKLPGDRRIVRRWIDACHRPSEILTSVEQDSAKAQSLMYGLITGRVPTQKTVKRNGCLYGPISNLPKADIAKSEIEQADWCNCFGSLISVISRDLISTIRYDDGESIQSVSIRWSDIPTEERERFEKLTCDPKLGSEVFNANKTKRMKPQSPFQLKDSLRKWTGSGFLYIPESLLKAWALPTIHLFFSGLSKATRQSVNRLFYNKLGYVMNEICDRARRETKDPTVNSKTDAINARKNLIPLIIRIAEQTVTELLGIRVRFENKNLSPGYTMGVGNEVDYTERIRRRVMEYITQ